MLKYNELKLIYYLIDKEFNTTKRRFTKKELRALKGKISELLVEFPNNGYKEPWFLT